MKTFAVLATFAAAVMAQDLSEVPACALPCFTNNVPISGCSGLTEVACLCGSDAYVGAVTQCVRGACSADDILTTRAWATATCEAVGVPIGG